MGTRVGSLQFPPCALDLLDLKLCFRSFSVTGVKLKSSLHTLIFYHSFCVFLIYITVTSILLFYSIFIAASEYWLEIGTNFQIDGLNPRQTELF